MITVGEAKASTLANIAGVSTASTEFLRFLNEATSRLLRRGDWPGTTVPIHVCVRNGCVVWPRFVENVRALSSCCRHVHVRGQWYDFLEYRNYTSCCASSSCCGDKAMNFIAQVATHTDIYGDGWYVLAYRQATIDNGKTLRIFGVDNYDQPLRTDNGDGTWSDGIVLTLVDTYAISTIPIRRIDRVVKEVTQGQVYLYQVQGNNPVDIAAGTNLVPIASYEPGEISPTYMRYRLNLPTCCTGGDDCGVSQSVVALVKLKYIEAKVDADLVLIDNLDALKDMMQSIKAKEAGDIASARAFEADAIRELNLQSSDIQPDHQMPIQIEPFSGTTLGSQRSF